MFQFELKRGFDRKFYLAVIVGCIITVSDFVISCGPMVRNVLEMMQETEFGRMLMNKTNYSISVMECFMGIRMSSLSYVYFFILPLLCSMPYTDSYCQDRMGYINMLAGRAKFVDYARSKMLITFLSAGCTAVIPLLVNLLLCMCFFPFLKPVSLIGRYSVMGESVLDKVFYGHPAIYLLIYMVFVFILYGLLNCVSITAVRIEVNSLAAFLSPFAVYYITHTIVVWIFNRTEWSPLRYAYFPNFKKEAIVGVGVELLILILSALFSYMVVRKKDV